MAYNNWNVAGLVPYYMNDVTSNTDLLALYYPGKVPRHRVITVKYCYYTLPH